MPTKAPSKSDLVPDLAGVVVDNGRLKLERKLGNGAYGVTYCARNLTGDGPPFVAVKCILRAGLTTHQVAHQRKEINNHYRVSSHRNVVSLYRTFEERGLLFMVMELASAGDMFVRCLVVQPNGRSLPIRLRSRRRTSTSVVITSSDMSS